MLFIRKYDPLIHHRQSIRLKGYNYARAGRYFITICCQDRICLFGRIENHEMIPNEAGKMIEKWFRELPCKFPDIQLGAFMVMPNHFHGIIINTGKYPVVPEPVCVPVGADLRVCPDTVICPDIDYNPESACESIIIKPGEHDANIESRGEHDANLESRGEHESINQGEHVGSPLPRVVQWFKTMTTNDYINGVKNLNWQKFNGKLWQRNYYEHVIRDKKSFQNISNYIVNNPALWNNDEFYR